MAKPKYSQRFRGYLLDQHSPDPPVVTLERFNAKEYIETYKAANIDSIIVYAKGHWGDCYYDTKVGHKHPGLRGDVLAEMVELGHQNDMEVAAYYSLGFDTWAVLQNPDWAERYEDGTAKRVTTDRKWHNVCSNSPYRAYALAQIAEIAGGYDVDGFFIDIFPFHWLYVCHCDYCERSATSMYGRRIGELSWHEIVEWTSRLRRVFWGEIRDAVKRFRPEAYVIVNGHFYREIVEHEDYVYTEAGHGTALPTLLARGCGLKYHQIGPGALSPIYDPRSLAMCKLDISGILAYGGRPMVYSEAQHPDGTLEQSFFDILGSVYTEVKQKQAFVEDAEPVKCIGVVYSDSTLFYYARTDCGDRFQKALNGAITTALQLHYPLDVLYDWKICPEELGAFDMVVLPDVVCLDDARCEAVREYVRNGGKLLATFKTSLQDGVGNLRDNFFLADVLGVDYLIDDAAYSANPFGSYLRCGEHEVTAGLTGLTLGMPGPFLKVRATSGESVGWHTLPVTAQTPERFVNWGSAPPGVAVEFPVVNLNRYGEGKVVYITAPIFKYATEGISWARRLIVNSLRWLQPEPCIYAEAPAYVEATFSRQSEPGRIVVHLLNRAISALGGEEAPASGAKLRLRKGWFDIQHVHQAWPDREELGVSECGHYLEVIVPPVQIHTIITISC